MKIFYLLLISAYGTMMYSCNQNTGSKTGTETQHASDSVNDLTGLSATAEESIDPRFLVTNRSVGLFEIGKAWQDIATKDYAFQFIQGYGSCIDGCCDGGFLAGDKIVTEESVKTIQNPEITIGAELFEKGGTSTKYKNDPDVFYVTSDNCNGWYRKDRVSYITIYSTRFKTKEGIGVGTTLHEVQRKFGSLSFYVGWIEEEGGAIRVLLKPYPNVKFYLDIEDYTGNPDDIDMSGIDNSLTIANFKPGTKIQGMTVTSEPMEND
ncbi:MAG: hypothetical protein J5I50_11515 [Chitinophagaceae bacterium]|nr:hypothetical protein [Chitinophagaceae bacterium]